jgi:hypothetical protein
MGRLDVRIVEARNLPNTETFGQPDPYVVVTIENTQHKTSVASSTLNPKWDEVFKFVLADPDSTQLELKLWDKNMISDAFMGQYRMSLSGLTKGIVKDVTCLLQQCKTNAEIRIRLLAQDFGRDPTPAEAAAAGLAAPAGAAPAPAPAPAPAQPPVVYQQPIAQPPVVYQQPIDQPPVVYQQPIGQPPVVYQQPIGQPPIVYQQPIAQPPIVYQQPIAQPPIVYQQPIVQQPIVQQPVVFQQPIVQQPVVYQQPIAQPAQAYQQPLPGYMAQMKGTVSESAKRVLVANGVLDQDAFIALGNQQLKGIFAHSPNDAKIVYKEVLRFRQMNEDDEDEEEEEEEEDDE